MVKNIQSLSDNYCTIFWEVVDAIMTKNTCKTCKFMFVERNKLIFLKNYFLKNFKTKLI